MSEEELQVEKLKWELDRQKEDRLLENAAVAGRFQTGATAISRLRGLLWAGLIAVLVAAPAIIWRAAQLEKAVDDQGKQLLELRNQADESKVKQIELTGEVHKVNDGLDQTNQGLRTIETKLDSVLKVRKR